MPNYINGRLFLTDEEMPIFRERLTRPSALAAEYRDAFLSDIAQTLTVTQVDGGVCLEFSSKKHNLNTSIATGTETDTYYCVRKPEAVVLVQYTRKMSKAIEVDRMVSDEKQPIRYGSKKQNEGAYFELLLSA